MKSDEPKMHGDFMVHGVGVYENGFVEISTVEIGYTNMDIARWRELNARVEELAKLAGV